VQLSAVPILRASSTARRLITGSEPAVPRQTGADVSCSALLRRRCDTPAEELRGRGELTMDLEADHRFRTRSRRDRSPCLTRCGGLQARCDAHHGPSRPTPGENLHADWQPFGLSAKGTLTAGWPARAGGDAADIAHCTSGSGRRPWIRRERHRRGRRRQQHVEAPVGGLERPDDQGPGLLSLAVVSVVSSRPTRA